MAFEPSKKKNQGKGRGLEKASEPDMLPIMNLMVCLIPVLLSAAEMVKIRQLNINLPAAGGAAVANPGMNTPEPAKDESQKLELSITVTKKGFFIASPGFQLGDLVSMQDPAVASQLDVIRTALASDASASAGQAPKRYISAVYQDGFAKEDFDKVTTALSAFKQILEIKNMDFSDLDKITVAAEPDIDYQSIISTIDAVRKYTDGTSDKDLFPVIEVGGF